MQLFPEYPSTCFIEFIEDVHIYLSKQIVNLPNLKIVDFSYGRTGSTHDSLAFKDTCIFQQHEDLFEDGEWIWADSAYTVGSFFSH
jgi:hypothetical protein